jgi:hypothetical protein
MNTMKLTFAAACLLALSACSWTDYLADVTKDNHSGCFSANTNYMGFTESVTYVHLGDNAAAVNASPACAGITASVGVALPSGTGGTPTGTIPLTPAPVGKTSTTP